MGRKGAPQPLRLSDPTVMGAVPSAASSAPTSTAKNIAAVVQDAGPGTAGAPGETLTVPSNNINSPASSKSPRSPRSPFLRFGKNKSDKSPSPIGPAQSITALSATRSQPSSPQHTLSSPLSNQGQAHHHSDPPTHSHSPLYQFRPIDEAIQSSLDTPASASASPETTTTLVSSTTTTTTTTVGLSNITTTSPNSHTSTATTPPAAGSAIASNESSKTPSPPAQAAKSAAATPTTATATPAASASAATSIVQLEGPETPSSPSVIDPTPKHQKHQKHKQLRQKTHDRKTESAEGSNGSKSSKRFFHLPSSKSSKSSHQQVPTTPTPHGNKAVAFSSSSYSVPSAAPPASSSSSSTSTAAVVSAQTPASFRGEKNMSKDPERPTMPGSNSSNSKTTKNSDHSLHKPISSHPSKSEVSLTSTRGDNDVGAPTPTSSTAPSTPAKRGKPKPFTLLHRTKSNRDTSSSPQDPFPPPALIASSTVAVTSAAAAATAVPARLAEPERTQTGLKTAPFAHERTFRDMMNSAVRNRSEDRASHTRDTSASRDDKHSRTQPSSFKENTGSTFLSNLRNSSRTAADMFSKGFFGKTGRSASTTEREPVVDDEHYVLKVINLPLLEQARLTRISKRLEDSRDKTEFWMPAFPWRAIDYLNYKGCDVEGLYRVPGSGPQVKKWQRKFDEEYDVDLFTQDDLYDINIVGSMLKAWLRELPDELFPKEAQERIARECAGAETVPPMLIDELSNLSPFKYYLLFAITCHLSLLLAHSDKNKMDFRNLCICFQPCMKIDAFCFKFLVCDWRDCWKGCKNEARYIEEEYTLFDQPPPTNTTSNPGDPRKKTQEATMSEDRAVSSSSDSKQSGAQEIQKSRLKKKAVPLPHSESNAVAAGGKPPKGNPPPQNGQGNSPSDPSPR